MTHALLAKLDPATSAARRFADALDLLAALEGKDVILKSEHADLRQRLSRGFEEVWSKVIREPFFNAGRWEARTEAEEKLDRQLGLAPGLHTAAGALKKAQAATAAAGPYRDALLAILEPWTALGVRSDALKAKVGQRKPAPTKTSVARDQREADAMTCQCCGRAILAETGLIAHHGYERPYEGYQTASCFGARHLPFEVSRDRLGQEIELVKSQLAERRTYRAQVEAETVALTYSWNQSVQDPRRPRGFLITKPRDIRRITRADFDAVVIDNPTAFKDAIGPRLPNWTYAPFTFDVLKAKALGRVDGQIAAMVDHLAVQERRYAAWKPTHQRQGDQWVALAA